MRKLIGAMKLRLNFKTTLVFVISLILPPLVVFLLVVLLPAVTYRFEESSRTASGPSPVTWVKKLTRIGKQGELHELSEKRKTLQSEEKFEQVRLQLAGSGEICLSVDLREGVVTLEFKGIPLRQCKIQSYKMSDSIRRLRAKGQLSQWLDTSFTVQEEWATIPKAPIRIKEAPKSAEEAEQAPPDDVPVETQDVNFTLQFDRNLTLSVKQIQPSSFSKRWQNTFSDLRQTLRTTGEALRSLFPSKNWSQDHPWIELELSREDAKAIYRALPQNAEMALRL